VGFGNVAPNTGNEKIIAIIVMLIGCKYYIYIYVSKSSKGQAFVHTITSFCLRLRVLIHNTYTVYHACIVYAYT
jgi:hypothetical protein